MKITNSVITNRKANTFCLRIIRERQAKYSSTFREFQTVLNKMNENLLYFHLIRENLCRYISIYENFKFNLLHVCDLLEHFACAIN